MKLQAGPKVGRTNQEIDRRGEGTAAEKKGRSRDTNDDPEYTADNKANHKVNNRANSVADWNSNKFPIGGTISGYFSNGTTPRRFRQTKKFPRQMMSPKRLGMEKGKTGVETTTEDPVVYRRGRARLVTVTSGEFPNYRADNRTTRSFFLQRTKGGNETSRETRMNPASKT